MAAWVAAISVLALIVLAISAFWVLVTVQDEKIEAWKRQLSATADDRRNAVEAWVEDQTGHARLVASFPVTSTALGTSATADVAHLAEVLASVVRAQPVGTIRVFDRMATEVVADPEAVGGCPGCATLARQVVETSREIVEQQFATPTGKPVFVFGVPVASPKVGSTAADGGAVGAVTLTVFADRWLYPFLARTPVPMGTGETVIIERRGDDAVFLSPLRGRADLPGSLRVPLGRARFAATEALAGQEVSGRFRDDRNVRVLAATRRLRNAPWGLVCKVDEAEVVASLPQPAWVAAAQLALGLVGLGGVGFLGAKSRWGELQLRVARSEARLATLVNQANDAIFLLDHGGRVLEANRRAEELYGYSSAELRRLSVKELRAPGRGTEVVKPTDEAWRGAGRLIETTHARRDGSTFPVEVSTRGFAQEGEQLTLGVVRDLTERKASEERIRQLNRILLTLSRINQAMVSARSRQVFLETACNILVDAGGYAMAWIGFVDPMSGRIVPAAVSGGMPVDLDDCPIRWDDSPTGNGLSGRAVRTGRRTVSADLASDPAMHPWRDTLVARGFRSGASLPLVVRGSVVGVVAIHAREVDAFKPEDLEILDQLALDVAHGIETLLDREELSQSEFRLRRALRASQENAARFHSVFEHAPVGIGLTDGASRQLCAVNPMLARMLGYAPEELVGMPPESIWPAAELERRTSMLESLRSGSRDLAEFRSWLRRKDGSKLPVRGLLTVIRGDSGEIDYVLGVFEDETARREAEVQVAKLSRAIEQSPVSVVVTDRQGTIEYVNRKFCRVTGYSQEEVVGRNPRILKSGETSAEGYRQLWDTISAGGEWTGEFHNRRKNGELFWEEAVISPLRDDEGNVTHFIAVKEDITARKLAEEELRSTQLQLNEAQKMEAIGLLAGGVAHDFNNLLTVILGFSELARRESRSGEASFELLDQVIAAGRRATDLTRQLLAFSRHQIVTPKVLEVGTLIADLDKMLHRLIGEHIRLQTEIPEGSARIEADPGQVEQVIVNLVVNARDAMPDGGSLRIEVASVALDELSVVSHPDLRPGAFVRIRVADSGCGIPEHVRARIFEPFFSTKEKGRGTGLGLSTVYGIVHKSGGGIEVRSLIGEGTTFDVYLPSVDKPLSTDLGDLGTESRQGDESILVVEDDDMVRRLTSRMLRQAGYRVHEASNPGEAFLIATEGDTTIDLMITDVVMPLMSGCVLAERVRGVRAGLPVIFMSGYTDDELLRHSLLATGAAFLQKPVSMDGLLMTVREVLDHRELAADA